MYYYLIAPLGLKSPPLTYECKQACEKDEICSISVRNKPYLGIIIKSLKKPAFDCKVAQKSPFYFLKFQKILATFIAQYYCATLGESYGLFTPKEGENLSPKPLQLKPLKALSTEQEEAFRFLKSQKNALLFGDTGSGKTEIYIHLIIHALAQGKNALFLMPEISLTPQIESRLKAVFGDMVGIWHSKITAPKKRQILSALTQGTIRIIAGARSALFLPIENLGLIIVDEEHDDAYKSQSAPRYQARDIALYLSTKLDIQVILGSATPSLTSYYHATKKANMHRLRGQYFNAQKHIIFSPESSISTESSPLDEALLTQIQKTLAQKQQAIIFLPTRAHYKMLVCSACGNGVECAFCSVNMSLHLDKNALICHYCHWSKPIPTACPHCHNPTLHSYRIGTAQVAKALQEALPQAKIALFDRDNITTHKKLTTTLEAFNNGEIDVLVGTQMLSKGHDYHRVNLAVVLGIDYVLKSSDYRCNERALSLLYQIAGRAGRKYDGYVYIQSANGAFLQPFMGDYEDFLRAELNTRPHIYPPHQRLATLTFAHKIESKAKDALEKVHKILKHHNAKEVEIVGDSKALLERLHDKYRFVLLLRSPSTRALLEAIHFVLSKLSARDICEIDIDPLSIL
ncbi:primosomal protein N' [Helicobacter jaachi]|uniref:Replication restart protein PriA n=1 Tax=Helicobacter jaachi TaxID=1677920 RepID=A0A4U8TAF5_9HELI|nr:primosomal protein N' [Helicobacter jaachi]TLD96108.1 primosomal protein N' [Helicobacter jaachi]